MHFTLTPCNGFSVTHLPASCSLGPPSLKFLFPTHDCSHPLPWQEYGRGLRGSRLGTPAPWHLGWGMIVAVPHLGWQHNGEQWRHLIGGSLLPTPSPVTKCPGMEFKDLWGLVTCYWLQSQACGYPLTTSQHPSPGYCTACQFISWWMGKQA